MASAREMLIATRPWSFQMTVISFLIGALYAVWRGFEPDPVMLSLALLGSILLHAAVNVWNDYFDYKSGVDRPGVGTTVYRPHPIVAGILSETGTLLYGTGLALAAMLIGVALTLAGRPLSLLLGAVGLVIAFSYTGPPLRLKYNGLGELGVLVTWGPLITGGACYIATGSIPWELLPVSIPFALLVTAVLLANNIRDIDTDRSAGLRTLAVRLGKDRAVRAYQAIIALAYLLLPALVAAGYLPPHTLIALVSLPQALKLAGEMASETPPDADPRTAKLATTYGILYITGLILAKII